MILWHFQKQEKLWLHIFLTFFAAESDLVRNKNEEEEEEEKDDRLAKRGKPTNLARL